MKHTILRTLILLLLFTASPTTYATNKSAAKVVENAAAKINKAASVSISFTAKASQGGSYSGTLKMSKDKFVFSSPHGIVWYNGHQQWAYSKATDEVNLTEPTADELLESNPFAIIKNYKTLFDLQSGTSKNGHTTVTFKAKARNSAVRSAVVTFSDTTGMPTAMVLTMNNNSTLNIIINKSTVGNTLPDSTFCYDPKQCAGAELIDLR